MRGEFKFMSEKRILDTMEIYVVQTINTDPLTFPIGNKALNYILGTTSESTKDQTMLDLPPHVLTHLFYFLQMK